MIERSRLPKKALDWGLNDSLAGVLHTLINILSQLIAPLGQLIQTILNLFTGTPAA